MPLTFGEGEIRFVDHCAVEEAPELAERLAVEPSPRLDLSDCGALHTALFQLILAARPEIAGWPPHAALAQALRRALSRESRP